MSLMSMSALKCELPRVHSSLLGLPSDILHVIIEQCDEYTWGTIRGTCRRMRIFTNISMSEETAARRVFANPKLYPTFPEGLKRSVLVATNALTRLPSLLYHEGTPIAVKTELEMVKVALVAARVLGQDRLYRRMCEEQQESSVVTLTQELESAMQKFERIFIKEIDGEILSRTSELWRIPPFILRYFQPREDVNVDLEAACFAYGGDSIGNNKDVLKSVVTECPSSMRYCSNRLLNLPNFVLELLSVNLNIFYLVSPTVRNDKAFVLKIIRNLKGIGGDFLQLVDDSLKDDNEVVMSAIEFQKEQDRFYLTSHLTESVLRFASARLKANREVMLAAVRRFGAALAFLYPDIGHFSDDKEIVMTALTTRNNEIQRAERTFYSEYYGHFEIFKKISGTLLEYVSDRLKDDEQVVFQAICNNIEEFKHASLRLKRNKLFCLRVLEQDKSAIEYLDIVMKRDPDIRRAASESCCLIL